MITYKMVIAYDGTDFFGWQIQADRLSVTNVLVNTFFTVFRRSIKITGASRTDSGVHALGQVAAFATDLEIEPQRMAHAWNSMLPTSIRIRKIEIAKQDFHPRALVRQKTYYSHFFLKRPLPPMAPYGHVISGILDRKKLAACLSVFSGTHDFRSFCTGDEQETTVRTIDSISLIYLKNYRCYRITIKGPGFLRYMIRRIVGACFDIACDINGSPDMLLKALDEKNPQQNYNTAPAKGLMLAAIRYAMLNVDDNA